MPITLPVTANGSCGSMSDAARFLAPGAALLLALFGTAGAPAGFVPGYVYVSDPGVPPVFDGGPPDRIWEVNPATGESRVFATIPNELSGGLTGLAFTPDGRHLRASAATAGSILEIDSDGNVDVALDRDDGLVFPIGASNLAYDSAGNFWVGDFFPARVLRFPIDGGAPDVILDGRDALVDVAAMAPDRTGDMWVAQHERSAPNLYRVSTEDEVQPLHVNGANPRAIATDRFGNVYIHSSLLGIYLLPGGDPTIPILLADDVPVGSLALSVSQQQLYVAGTNELAVIDLASGDVANVWHIAGSTAGEGMAVYVPEPTTLALVLVALVAVQTRHRQKRGECSCCATDR